MDQNMDQHLHQNDLSVIHDKTSFSVNLILGHVSQVVFLFLLFKFKLYQSEGFQSFHT